MTKRKLQVLALALALVMLLSGCSYFVEAIAGSVRGLLSGNYVHYEDMEYIRPDVTELEQVLDECCSLAETETDIDVLMEAVYRFYDIYDRFYTSYFMADIRYSGDLTDSYWEKEYTYCMENISAADAGLDELFYALAKSPIREELESDDYFGPGFFDGYEGESIWDEDFISLMEQEAQLQSKYYDLSAQALEVQYYSEEFFTRYGTQMAELFVELVALRQEIAAYVGYDSYPQFAYDFYHYRDYAPAEAEAYLQRIGTEFSDLYRQINRGNVWELGYDYCSEQDTFRYVKNATANMGGTVEEAFWLLESAGLYDIAYGENKMDGAFETYLWSYYEPFIFMRPYMDQSDKLSFSHEFGHFVNDYVCYGSNAGTDVAEVHSQAMEYLCLLYGEDTEDLEQYKMADCLCTYVEQAAYALFEQQVYGLEGEDLTVENVQALYEEIGTRFGFDSWSWDSRDYVAIEHFFSSPMYIISYVVSNDVAFQIYQLERAEAGAGLAVYEQCVTSMDSYLVYFAENYGLESPFAPGRLESVRSTLEAELEDYL